MTIYVCIYVSAYRHIHTYMIYVCVCIYIYCVALYTEWAWEQGHPISNWHIYPQGIGF